SRTRAHVHGRLRRPGRPPARSTAGRRLRPHRWNRRRVDRTAAARPPAGCAGGDAGRCRAGTAAPAPGPHGRHRRVRPPAGPPAAAPPPFPLVRDRIFPLLKRTAALPPEAGYVRGNRIVRRPLDDQISVAYVIEGQHRMTLVTDAMPESWRVTTDHLHRLAVDNL